MQKCIFCNLFYIRFNEWYSNTEHDTFNSAWRDTDYKMVQNAIQNYNF